MDRTSLAALAVRAWGQPCCCERMGRAWFSSKAAECQQLITGVCTVCCAYQSPPYFGYVSLLESSFPSLNQIYTCPPALVRTLSSLSPPQSAKMGSNTPQWTPQTGKSLWLFRKYELGLIAYLSLVLSTLPHPPEENTTSPIPFFHLLERLKTTKREGWRRFGINGESISDHMYRMSIMTMFAPSELASKLNIPHCTKMALIHDMAESLVGDITPVDKEVTKAEKARREADVMDYITETLLGKIPGGALSAQEIKRVFQEYEDNVTLEAQFVHDIDKMELLLQMVEYERAHNVDLSEFERVANRVQLPEIKVWAQQVVAERPKRA